MYVLFGGMVLVMVLVLGNLLMFLFSSSVILDLSSRRCWVVVVCLGGLFGRSAEGADGNRMSTWNGSIGAGLAGVSMVSSAGNSDGLFGGGIEGGAVGSPSFGCWSLV